MQGRKTSPPNRSRFRAAHDQVLPSTLRDSDFPSSVRAFSTPFQGPDPLRQLPIDSQTGAWFSLLRASCPSSHVRRPRVGALQASCLVIGPGLHAQGSEREAPHYYF
eukprot:1183842-Prorocentrum_minimum.AAC.3